MTGPLRQIASALATAILVLPAAALASPDSRPGTGPLALAGAEPWPVSALPAHAAGTVMLNETGRLLETSRHNFTLNEEGSASGTVPGTIYVHLTTVSSIRVTAEVNIYPHGGSLTGYGTGTYRREDTAIDFSGSMEIERGTGHYAGVHGSGLSFSGTIQESSRNPITVRVVGKVSS